MFTSRILTRTLARRQPLNARLPIQRRLNSTAAESAKEKGNAFIKEREAVKHHAAQSSELWRKITFYCVPPAMILTGINAWNLWNEHWEHWAHMPPLEERPQYPYQNIRVKNFFWGDGDKTLFWNDNVNYNKTD